MSKVGVSLKILVTDIDKERLFQGKKGKYLDATVFIDLDQLDQYGNSGMITQDVSKEEKAQGVQGNILGNCKVFWSDSQQAPQQNYQQTQQPQQNNRPPQQNQPQGMQQNSRSQPAPSPDDFDDDIPFANPYKGMEYMI